MNMTLDEWNEYCRIMASDDLDAMRVYVRMLEEKHGRKDSLSSAGRSDGSCSDGRGLGDHDGTAAETTEAETEMGQASGWMDQTGGK